MLVTGCNSLSVKWSDAIVKFLTLTSCHLQALRALPNGTQPSISSKTSSSSSLLVSLLLNVSACATALKKPQIALRYAAAAAAVEPSSSKSRFRAALALSGLGEHSLSKVRGYTEFEQP